MNKPYHVYKQLALNPAKFMAAYKTLEQAEKACAFWNAQKGAVNEELFRAWIVIRNPVNKRKEYRTCHK